MQPQVPSAGTVPSVWFRRLQLILQLAVTISHDESGLSHVHVPVVLIFVSTAPGANEQFNLQLNSVVFHTKEGRQLHLAALIFGLAGTVSDKSEHFSQHAFAVLFQKYPLMQEQLLVSLVEGGVKTRGRAAQFRLQEIVVPFQT